MKYLPLIWSGLWRKRVRALFTFLSVAIAFFLFGVLHSIENTFSHATNQLSSTRLYVTSRVSSMELLPVSMLETIEQIPGVKGIAPEVMVQGTYQDPKNPALVFAIFPDRDMPMFPELRIADDQFKALMASRTAAVIGRDMVTKYGWKIGDRIPLDFAGIPRANDSTSWEFDVVGIWDVPGFEFPSNVVEINYSYFDEERTVGKGGVNWFVVGTDAKDTMEVARAIDDRFANSPHETETKSEKEFWPAFVRQFGDISLVIRAIVTTVFATLIFSTSVVLMHSFNERMSEVAVLKVLGYGANTVFFLLIAESLVLILTAAALGLGVASASGALATAFVPQLASLIGDISISWDTQATGIVIAMIMGAVCGLVPAFKSRALNIVDVLAKQ